MTCESRPEHTPRLVVLTGGPGAGKTAVLEIVRRHFCEHVQILPEAASIVFGGGFPREPTLPLRCAAQRAIFHVQRELERAAIESRRAAVVLCDRGTIDGVAYWPLDEESFWADVGASRASESTRYAAVIHLRTPAASLGYGHTNPLRIETALEAASIDRRIEQAWAGHPRRSFVDSESDFLTKVEAAVARIREQVPECCRMHRIPEVDSRPAVGLAT
jgi:predicted ATPase